MEFLKAQIISITKYAIAGVIISLIGILICLLIGKEYPTVLNYISAVILIIGLFGVVGTISGTSGRSVNIATLKPYETHENNNKRTSSAIFRALKLFLTAYVIFFISRI